MLADLRRKLSVKADIVYFAAIGCIIIVVSLVIQPRYSYAFYVLLCLEATKKKDRSPLLTRSPIRRPELQHA